MASKDTYGWDGSLDRCRWCGNHKSTGGHKYGRRFCSRNCAANYGAVVARISDERAADGGESLLGPSPHPPWEPKKGVGNTNPIAYLIYVNYDKPKPPNVNQVFNHTSRIFVKLNDQPPERKWMSVTLSSPTVRLRAGDVRFFPRIPPIIPQYMRRRLTGSYNQERVNEALGLVEEALALGRHQIEDSE